ncbi:hypothetical protein AGMMS50256_16950 [Betaproteobacteria bacterium]|nr:hypothetical protein AGMMS50256_16950 [Betaproteobacteria bacterium]
MAWLKSSLYALQAFRDVIDTNALLCLRFIVKCDLTLCAADGYFDSSEALGVFIEFAFDAILSGLESFQVFKHQVFNVFGHDVISCCVDYKVFSSIRGMCFVGQLHACTQAFFTVIPAKAGIQKLGRVWQDVYHAPCPNGKTAYIRLTLRDGAVVIQFKEKG